MEEIEINGKSYLIDIEKATEQGLLKEKTNRPMSWREYDAAMEKERYGNGEAVLFSIAESVFPTKEEATAFAAICRLIHLRDAWWGDWRPDWEDETRKYCIYTYLNNIETGDYESISHILSFPTEQMCDEFLETFSDLIEQAKMFL